MANHSEDKHNWREKYLDALDAQDRLEKSLAEQHEQLRKALVRVSIVAEGQDEALDRLMAQLREQLRTEKVENLEKLLAQLEDLVIHFESRRDQASQDIRESLGGIVRPLQRFQLSRGLKKEIQQYLAQLPERSKKVRLYPALLGQLAQIQEQALAAIEQPKNGLLHKLFNTKIEHPSARPDTADIELEDLDALALEEEQGTGALKHAVAQPNALQVSERQSPDLSSSEWMNDLIQIVESFLQSLEQDSQVQQEVLRIRKRLHEGLAKGLDSSVARVELLGSLSQVRHLVMDAYLAVNQTFASYLDNVNHELAGIYQQLSGATQTHQDQRQASQQLQVDMMREMNDLEQQATQATDLNQLKSQVQSQLGNIRHALERYQQSDQANQQLSQQLNNLGEKIKLMEVEAESNRVNLEQQRHKALHDPLTELPNREAYKERALAEVQRWERYGRPLTLAVVDIDHFKKINDNYGHQAGDRVIKVIGRSIAKRLREVDFFCRYGGEEFVALMPETSAEVALGVLEKIRDAIARAAFNYKEQPLAITVSIGLTEFRENDSLESAFERADQALYTAKAKGRNCCCSG